VPCPLRCPCRGPPFRRSVTHHDLVGRLGDAAAAAGVQPPVMVPLDGSLRASARAGRRCGDSHELWDADHDRGGKYGGYRLLCARGVGVGRRPGAVPSGRHQDRARPLDASRRRLRTYANHPATAWLDGPARRASLSARPPSTARHLDRAAFTCEALRLVHRDVPVRAGRRPDAGGAPRGALVPPPPALDRRAPPPRLAGEGYRGRGRAAQGAPRTNGGAFRPGGAPRNPSPYSRHVKPRAAPHED
jgi:hypothetical protein